MNNTLTFQSALKAVAGERIFLASEANDALTYEGLGAVAARFQARFSTVGLSSGDAVAVIVPEGPTAVATIVATLLVAVAAPINSALAIPEMLALLQRIRPRAVIVGDALEHNVRTALSTLGLPVMSVSCFPHIVLTAPQNGHCSALSVAAARNFGAAGIVLPTSGTGGDPKLVYHGHAPLLHAAHAIATVLELTSADRNLCVLPCFHIHGLSTVLSTLLTGGCVIAVGPFSTQWFESVLLARQVSWLSATPTHFQAFLDSLKGRAFLPEASALRLLRSASAPMSEALLAATENAFSVPVIQAYGMTEAGPQIASNGLAGERRRRGSVGRPAGAEVEIRSIDGQSLACNTSGEIVIRGAGVFQGYIDDTQDDAKRVSSGWFYTGDLGFLDADGFLYVTGRSDDLINSGGEKLAPQQIESVLRGHPAVQDVAVFPAPHAVLGEAPHAAIVLREGFLFADGPHQDAAVIEQMLRRYCLSQMVSFKVPHTFQFMQTIPVTENKKLQRRKLHRLLDGQTHKVSRAPTNEIPGQRLYPAVVAVWVDVLGPGEYHANDNFFQRGGDSLTAAMAINRLAHEFTVVLPPNCFFLYPTIEQQIALLERLSVGQAATALAPYVSPVSHIEQILPLSGGQRRLWFLCEAGAGSEYNMSSPLWLRGALNIESLTRAINALRQRHSALRTTINRLDGQPVQRIVAFTPLQMTVVDLSHLPADSARKRALGLAAEHRNAPFDLASGPLFRFSLLRLQADCHLLLIAVHHIICDGWSMEVLRRDLRMFYHAFSAGENIDALTDVPQYADYVARERAGKAEEEAKKRELVCWWGQQLQDIDPVLQLSPAAVHKSGSLPRGARLHFEIPDVLMARLGALAERFRTTPYTLFVGSLGILLHGYSGQQRFCIGTVLANRGSADMEQVVGFFARTLPLPVNISATDTIEAVLLRSAAQVREILAHANLEFDDIVQASGVARHSTITPLFQVMLAFQNIPQVLGASEIGGGFDTATGLAMESIIVDGDSAKYDLTLYVRPDQRGVKGIWQYRPEKIDTPVIERMCDDFLTILTALVDTPQMSIAAIPFNVASPLDPVGKAAQEAVWHSPPLLTQAFAHQVSVDSHRIAISAESGQSTYGVLSGRINRLANFLSKALPQPAPIVAVLLPRDDSMVVASMAVMTAGAAFLPLDPGYPLQRLREMLTQVDVGLVIVNASSKAMLSALACDRFALPQSLCLDNDSSAILQSSATPPARLPSPDDAAYVIFTSGSTGTPKGVVLSHGNLAHYIEAMSGELGIVETDNYLYTASCAFSSSVRQFALPLANGATVVIASREQTENMTALMELVATERISILDLVPTAWQACHRWLSLQRGRVNDNVFAQPRLLLSASEPLPSHLAENLMAYWPQAELINMYGQTETTGIVAMNKACAELESSSIVPLGKPHKSATIVLLDAQCRPVPTGMVGEICVGGPCVGKGYISERVLVPLATARPVLSTWQGPETLYRTGDLGRYRDDGVVEYCGRMDLQIKYRGFRIEPADIEAVALSYPAISEAAVVLVQRPSRQDAQELQLVYCAVGAGGQPVDEAHLRQYLRRELPDYMVPSKLIEMHALPRTPAGKVDRVALVSASQTGVSAASGIPSLRFGRGGSDQSAVMQSLILIWKDVLGCDDVGPHDNFFDLGGNSILSIEVVADAMEAGVQLNLDQLFQYQTIAELAPVIVAGQSAAGAQRKKEFGVSGEPAVIDVAELPRYSAESLRAFSLEALKQAGLSPEGARILTEVQLESSLRGQVTHNIGDIPRYAKRLLKGVLNARPSMTVTDTSAISATVDGDNAPGQWVATVAMDKAIALAERSGAGFVSVKRSNHFGAAGHYAWRASQAGMIGMCFTNGPVVLAPTGGVTPLFGNNPLAIGLPCGDRDPVVLDISMSVATRGKIGLTVAEGEPLQHGWILDKLGIPSTQLEDLAAGLAAPIGGHKGYGLAFAIEVLAGALSGAGYCSDHNRVASASHGGSDIGHLFIAFNPDLLLPRDQYEMRLADIVQQAKSSALAKGSSEIFVPGEIELRARRDNLRRGIPLPESTARRLTDYGERHNLRARIQRTGRD